MTSPRGPRLTPPRAGVRQASLRPRPTPGDDPGLIDLLGIVTPPAWSKDAACGQGHPDAWYPELGEPNAFVHAAIARRICWSGCPVRIECLELALKNNETEGIWGGLSPVERKRLGRSRRQEQPNRPAA